MWMAIWGIAGRLAFGWRFALSVVGRLERSIQHFREDGMGYERNERFNCEFLPTE